MDRGTWRAAVHGVVKSRTQLSGIGSAHRYASGELAAGLTGFFWGEVNPKVTTGYVNHSWEATGSAETGGGWESILSLEEKKEENGSWGTMVSL